MEGEVRLLLLMDDKGALLDVRVASSSGHALLDQAAMAAARAAGTFAGAGRELILPVVFRLSD
jgi:protein TonB